MLKLEEIDFTDQKVVIEYIGSQRILLHIVDNEKFQDSLSDYLEVKNQLIENYTYHFEDTDRFYELGQQILFEGDFSMFNRDDIPPIAHICLPGQKAEVAPTPKNHLNFMKFQHDNVGLFNPLPSQYESMPGTEIEVLM